jgi:hypothetical protein
LALVAQVVLILVLVLQVKILFFQLLHLMVVAAAAVRGQLMVQQAVLAEAVHTEVALAAQEILLQLHLHKEIMAEIVVVLIMRLVVEVLALLQAMVFNKGTVLMEVLVQQIQ